MAGLQVYCICAQQQTYNAVSRCAAVFVLQAPCDAPLMSSHELMRDGQAPAGALCYMRAVLRIALDALRTAFVHTVR
jgi:hypothetical protein